MKWYVYTWWQKSVHKDEVSHENPVLNTKIYFKVALNLVWVYKKN